ncbi:MAG: leucyl aminopeptidase [Clostridium sp.]
MMNINFRSKKCTEVDGLMILLCEDNLNTPNEEINSILNNLKTKEKFQGKKSEIYSVTREINGVLQDVIFVGLGKKADLKLEGFKLIINKSYKKAEELKINNLFVRMVEVDKLPYNEMAKEIALGFELAAYKFDKYKGDKKKNSVQEVSIGAHGVEDGTSIEEAINEGKDVAEGICIARNLVNEPANVIYPATLAEEAVRCGKEYGFQVEVLGLKEIEDLKMEAFLSVARASAKEPKFIVMRYFGDEANKDNVLGLVGKGLTYDSGGYSIKPTAGMDTMKCDMGGSAAVIGAMSLVAKRGLKANVIAVVAACENMIDGNGYKPGDIIGSMAGKTIEVLNTDAEGRLTLADAVHYIIEKEKVNKVIDIATLTGAVLVALGDTTTAVVTNNEEFYNELIEASKKTGEKFWQLPAFDEYKELIKSDIADLKNIGGRLGGTITAGLFIGEFVKEIPWLHLDIAGTAWRDGAKGIYGKGGTGEPVATLYTLVKDRV